MFLVTTDFLLFDSLRVLSSYFRRSRWGVEVCALFSSTFSCDTALTILLVLLGEVIHPENRICSFTQPHPSAAALAKTPPVIHS